LIRIRHSEVAAACLGLALTVGLAGPAFAADVPDGAKAEDSPILSFSAGLTVDGVAPLQGGPNRKAREIDLLAVGVSADFEKLGWHGGSGQLTLQNTSGQMPNSDLGTLEGIDNSEVAARRGRVFEAWLQQDFNGKGSLKLGLIDLNSEFYNNGASGVLIAPQFGIGSELAASGPAGPSIYPQTSLAARLNIRPTKDTYLQAGVFNADLDDPAQIDTRFKLGVLEIIEGGWTPDGNGKFAIGAWRNSKKQDDLFDTVAGAPVQRTPSGAYVLAERVFVDGGDMGRSFAGFFRGGFSDGDTGPFRGGWQVGGLMSHVFASRPDSQFSFAVDQALLGGKYRKASAAGGAPLETAETHFEITYADQVHQHIVIQPDLQYILNPGGDGAAKNELVFLLRLKASFGG
jgi:porin